MTQHTIAINASSINELEQEVNKMHALITIEYGAALCRILEGKDFDIIKKDINFYRVQVTALHRGLNVAMNFTARPHTNRTVHFCYYELDKRSPLGQNATRTILGGYIMSDSGLKKILRHISKEISYGKTFSDKI